MPAIKGFYNFDKCDDILMARFLQYKILGGLKIEYYITLENFYKIGKKEKTLRGVE